MWRPNQRQGEKPPKQVKPLTPQNKARLLQIDDMFDRKASSKSLYSKKTSEAAVKLSGIQKVRDLMNDPRMGLDDKKVLTKLKKAMNATRLVWSKEKADWIELYDWNTTIKALELALKLKGYIGNDNKEDDSGEPKKITVNFNLVKARDQEEVKRLLEGTASDETVRSPVIKKILSKEVIQGEAVGINEMDKDSLDEEE